MKHLSITETTTPEKTQPPDPNSFPSSHKVHEIDQKGNLLSPVQLSLDLQYFNLKVEKLDHSIPATPRSPMSPYSPKTPKSPYPTPSPSYKRRSGLWQRFSFGIASRTSSRLSSSGYSSSSSCPSVLAEDVIPFSEINEIRLSEYNSKTAGLTKQARNELKPLAGVGGGSRKHFTSQYKMLEVLFGNEFNLKRHKFVVIGVVEFCKQQQQKEQKTGLEEWVERVETLLSEFKSMGYFEKLDWWYRKQFDLTINKNTDHHRLKLWKQFLHRTHNRVSTESLQKDYDTLERLLLQENSDFCRGSVEKSEFDLVARYFVHSSKSMSKIFEQFCPAGDNNLLQLLDIAKEEELNDHPVLGTFQKLFRNYFEYVQNSALELPRVSGDMDGVSTYTKTVIRKFHERFNQNNSDQLIQEKWLSSYYILDYLYSTDNSIWSPEKIRVYQDMTRPLSHYYISSSHNTYLTGDQYSSESSAECYRRVLLQGCRCIEIDAWNGPSNKPQVKHGRTLTPPCNLKDVLVTIKQHAFVTSPYPVIISMENHCNLRQQRNMVKHFRKVFGKMLITTPITENNGEGEAEITQLPSPEDLKYKIILKGRKLPPPAPKEETPPPEDNSGDPNNVPVDDVNMFPQGVYPALPEALRRHESLLEQDASPCDCLITGELWKRNDSEKWINCIFVLTNKKLFYIEKHEDDFSHGKLPHYMTHSSEVFMRQSVASLESNQDLHNDQLWFHGRMAGGRQAAVSILEQHAVNGSFLVRGSDTTNGYTLCFYYRDPDVPIEDQGPLVNHCHIHNRRNLDGQQVYFLRQNPEESEMFLSIFELIEYYMRNPVITNRCRLESLGSPVPPSTTHEAQEWFYTDMDRKSAETILEKLPINGAFLGRYRTGDRSEIVISFRFENVIKHCHIKREGIYLTVSNSRFHKLETLVDHYSRNPFYRDNIKLSHPVGKQLHAQSQQSDCIQRVYACPDYVNSTVKTVKGRVRAIQSHQTTDPELLSFKKGDVIVNVIKESSGWWTGTREDAVGDEAVIPKQFPESFVEDMEELEECPFGDFVPINRGTWKLGSEAKVKLCTDKSGKERGIKYYISFRYAEDRTKKKLGASCSKRKVNEWVDMINHVISTDRDGQIALAKILAAEKYNIASEFSDLIVYCCAMDKKLCPDDFEWRRDRVNVCLTKSLDELSGDRLFRSNAPFFVWYHQYALTRVYPKGFRLDSSNYNPARFWNCGSQMVALNFQKPDKAMQWNRGKFRQNGNCGYVLKPDLLIPGDRVPDDSTLQFDPTRLTEEEPYPETWLTIQIISARHLEKQGPGQITPVVEVEVIGIDTDCRKVKTSWQETGLNPHWNQSFDFKLRCPELALIQFSVCHVDTFSDRLLLGESTIPFPCIRPGYKSVQLNNAYGLPLISTLLVFVSIDQQESMS